MTILYTKPHHHHSMLKETVWKAKLFVAVTLFWIDYFSIVFSLASQTIFLIIWLMIRHWSWQLASTKYCQWKWKKMWCQLVLTKPQPMQGDQQNKMFWQEKLARLACIKTDLGESVRWSVLWSNQSFQGTRLSQYQI